MCAKKELKARVTFKLSEGARKNLSEIMRKKPDVPISRLLNRILEKVQP